MRQASAAPGAAPPTDPAETGGLFAAPGLETFTTIHFVLIALLLLATLLAIAWGVRKARTRREAEQRARQDAIEAGVPPAPPAPGGTELREAPLAPQALDRSTVGLSPTPPAHDDFTRPRPIAPGPVPTREERPAPPPAAAPPPPPGEAVPSVRAPADEAPPSRPLEDERIAAAAPLDASPATQADPAPAHAAPSPADGPVTQLKGLGPKVAARLAELGITSVGQIAALDADQAQALDARLGPFAGRLHRDRWIEQARFLAAGDRTGFEAVFGKL